MADNVFAAGADGAWDTVGNWDAGHVAGSIGFETDAVTMVSINPQTLVGPATAKTIASFTDISENVGKTLPRVNVTGAMSLSGNETYSFGTYSGVSITGATTMVQFAGCTSAAQITIDGCTVDFGGAALVAAPVLLNGATATNYTAPSTGAKHQSLSLGMGFGL